MSYKLLFSFFLLSSQISLSFTQCLGDQRSSLLQLKQSFTNVSASKLASWQPNNTDCCTWQGVSCDSTAGYVIGLDLNSCSISGPVNGSLFNLVNLETLNLANNSFNSVLPSGFDRLVNLTHLNLSNSGFQGRIPIEISSLSRLVVLDLSTSYLISTLFSLRFENSSLKMLVQSLTNLRDLRLDGINISAQGSEWGRALSALTNLRTLSLAGCYLSGPIDSSLSLLRNLSQLDLSGNDLSSVVPDFLANFSSLTILRLGLCGLYGKFPESIFQLRNLQILEVWDNEHLTGFLPGFSHNNALRVLLVPECNFSGTIPASLGNLTQLVHLDLSWNNFDGQIPSLASLKNVEEINLSHNLLTGPLPFSYGVILPNLTNLDLRNNSLNGSLPSSLFTLPSLQTLQLAQNQFGGGLPDFNVSTSVVETVDLSNNKLQGPIPNALFKLARLKVLILSSNNFSGTVNISMFQTLTNLTNLDLSGNSLSIIDDSSNSTSFVSVSSLKLGSSNLGKFPDFLKNLKKLNYLDLSNNKIGGPIPSWIWNLGNLVQLNLSHNALTGLEQPLVNLSSSSLHIIDLHSNMLEGSIPLPPPSASFIDYSNNNFTSAIPDNISSYLNFTIFFSLSSNNLSGKIPSSICNAKYLQVLDFSNNHFNSLIPECLAEMGSSLRILNLRNNDFHGTMPQKFIEGCVLRTLDLNRNQLDGMLPKSLINCKMLEVLDLGNNQINDTFPSWLETLLNLSVLVLRSNKFSGPIMQPGSNFSFPSLQIMDLSSNRFTGNIPSSCLQSWNAMMGNEGELQIRQFHVLKLSNLYYQDMVMVTSKGLDMELVKILTIFTSIDLSNNKFQGEIPKEIGELKSLYVLNLSHNTLTGPIPSSIGNLRQLESLDLSRNNLSGEIPLELISLTFLSVLNLSLNLLVGSIPQGQQFLTFSNDSFEGNSGLCGPPLSGKCRNVEVLSPLPTALDHSDEQSKFRCNWLLIFIELGFAVGLGIVIGPLVFWRKWRRWYYKRIDGMLFAIFGSDRFSSATTAKTRKQSRGRDQRRAYGSHNEH